MKLAEKVLEEVQADAVSELNLEAELDADE